MGMEERFSARASRPWEWFDMDRVAIQDELDMKQQEAVTLTSRITLRVGHEAVDVIKAKGGDKHRARLIKL